MPETVQPQPDTVRPNDDPRRENSIARLGRIYDAKETNAERIDLLLRQLPELPDEWEGADVMAAVIDSLHACADAPDRESFIAQCLAALNPLFEYERQHPLEWYKIIRRAFVEKSGFTPLNEVLSYGQRKDGESIHIHLVPAQDLKNLRKLVVEGFHTLAQLVRDHPEEWENLRHITATSWIVGEHPGLMEKLGFVIEGPIDDEARRKHFPSDTRQISRAAMDRDTLLSKY